MIRNPRSIRLFPTTLRPPMALDFKDTRPTNDMTDRREFAGRDRLKLTPQLRWQIDAE
jgi:hypothetical protein